MEDRMRKGSTFLAKLLVMIMLIGVIPILPGGKQVEAAADKKVYVKVTAMYSYAYEVLDRVNEERAAEGLDPLVMDKLLLEAAMQRAADQVITIAATGGLSHTTNYGERYLDTQDRSYGENIAAGQSTPKEVMDDWMNSSGHRANILREGYTSIGIGCVKCGAGYYVYWAQEFGYCEPEKAVKSADLAKTFTIDVSNDVYAELQDLSASYDSVVSFKDPGQAAAGWKKEAAGWKYYQADGTAAVGWLKVENTWYLMDAAGIMVTGWSKVGGKYYYFAASGAMVTGWRQIGGTWYYFSGGGAMATGWKKIGGTWYYFTGGGAMVTGWRKIGNVWYYFQNSGAMKTGWLNFGGNWYFLNGSGVMVTGSRDIKGKLYFFNSSGVCLNP